MATKINYAQEPRIFIETVIPVEDRDSNEIVPFTFRYAQSEYFDTIQQIRAFNIFKSATRSGTIGALARACKRLGFLNAREAVDTIVEKGVDRILHVCKVENDEKRVTDSPVRSIILKGRRLGFSTEIAAIGLWKAAHTDNTKMLVVAHEGKAANNLLRITNTFHQFWDETKTPKPDLIGDAATMLAFSNRSYSQVKTAGSKDVRSFQVDILHLSEFAFYESASAIGAALMGLPKHCWVFVESTANGNGGSFHERYTRAKTIEEVINAWDAGEPYPDNTFIKTFASWLDDPSYEIPCDFNEKTKIMGTLSDYERSLFQRFPQKATPEKIKWHRFMLSEAEHDVLTPQQFMLQEYPASEEEAFQNAGEQIFDVTKQRARAAAAELSAVHFRVHEGLRIEVSPLGAMAGTNLKIFEKPRVGELYILAADLSKGLRHKDATVLSIFARGDGTRLRQVAEFRGWLDQSTCGELAVMLAEWYNDAFLIQEINDATHFAATVVDRCGYWNIYTRQTFDMVVAESKSAFRYGFLTGSSTKKLLIEGMKTALREDLIYLASIQGVKELDGYTRDEKGAYGAKPGQHDDCVISYALAVFGSTPGAGAPSITKINSARTNPENGEVLDTAAQIAASHASLDETSRFWVEQIAKMERIADGIDDDGFSYADEDPALLLLKNPHAVIQ